MHSPYIYFLPQKMQHLHPHTTYELCHLHSCKENKLKMNIPSCCQESKIAAEKINNSDLLWIACRSLAAAVFYTRYNTCGFQHLACSILYHYCVASDLNFFSH